MATGCRSTPSAACSGVARSRGSWPLLVIQPQRYGHGRRRTLPIVLVRSRVTKSGQEPQSVMRWVCGYVDQHCPKPKPGPIPIIEIDEMWHYLDRKTNRVWI